MMCLAGRMQELRHKLQAHGCTGNLDERVLCKVKQVKNLGLKMEHKNRFTGAG